MKEKIRQCETRDREIIFPRQSFEENISKNLDVENSEICQLTVPTTSEGPRSLQKEKNIDSERPKAASKKKMTVGRERYYILRKREMLMKQVKDLNSANYEFFQVSVNCVFYLKDKQGNYIDREQSASTAENEEIYKIF